MSLVSVMLLLVLTDQPVQDPAASYLSRRQVGDHAPGAMSPLSGGQKFLADPGLGP
jgi:hypothetical protein